MSRKYKIRDQDRLYFVTFTVIAWLDVSIRQEYRDIFLDSLRYCQKHKGLEVCAYCIMSSHVHLIIGRNSEQSLQGIIRDIKKYTSVKITEAIYKNHRESRQQHSHPIQLNTNSIVEQKLNYIHNNPVKAGIVLSPEDYLYSSAINYAGRPEKLLEVILL
jgi:putative transposase